MKAPVRLRSPDPDYNVFLAAHEITVGDDQIKPLMYQGRLFVFLKKTLIGSYQYGFREEAYEFADAGPAWESPAS